MFVEGCFTCRNTQDVAAPIRERVVRTENWRAAHAYDTALPGWLILAPTEHVTSLDELSGAATAELGRLLGDLTRALKAVTGCVKTYVLLMAEKPGFSHLHFHVIPRAADLADELKGPGIFALLGATDEQRVSDAQQDALTTKVRSVL